MKLPIGMLFDSGFRYREESAGKDFLCVFENTFSIGFGRA